MVLRRAALGFPLTSWSHRRPWNADSVAHPGAGRYFIEWDPGNGVYGEDWDDAPRDRAGVLLSGPQHHYHPIRIAQFALHRFAVGRAAANSEALADFIAQAQWLRDNQADDAAIPGIYRFNFAWSKYGAGAGWSSAMAQGEAISVLLRAESLETGKGFGDAAMRAAQAFRRPIERGGVVWHEGNDVFFEEIANEHAPHVLNGCIFALWGVWELWKQSGEPWLGDAAERCVDTLRRWLPRFDTGWWTLYSLLHSAARRPHLATLKYHQFHIAQMRVLGRMFDDDVFDDAAERWTSYAAAPDSRSRLMRDTLLGLPERFLGRDTVSGGART